MKLSLGLGGGPTAAIGAAPSLSAGGRLFGSVRWRALSLELGVQADLPVSKTSDAGSGFKLTSFGAALAPCAHWDALLLCGVAEISRIRAQGFGVDEVRSPTSTLVRAGARLGVEQPLSEQLELMLHVDALGLLTRRTIYVNAAAVWTTPDVAMKLGLDLVMHFR